MRKRRTEYTIILGKKKKERRVKEKDEVSMMFWTRSTAAGTLMDWLEALDNILQ